MRRSIVSALAIMLLGACSTKEMDFQTPVLDDDVFYASFELPTEDGTRVYANEDLRLRWNADDRVSIFNNNTYNQQYKFTGNTGDNAGEFSIVQGGSAATSAAIPHVVAVYPYRESTEITEGEVLTVTLPAEQEYAQNTFGLGANTMVSVSTDNLLQFKTVGGFLRISLYGEDISVYSITLKGNNGEKIAGDATVTMTEGGTPTLTMADDASTEITLKCSNPVTVGKTSEQCTQFWFVLPPTTFSKGFTISVMGPDCAVFKKSTTKSISVGRNLLSKMSPIEVSYPSITDLSKNVTANCYIVPGEGSYCFKANIKGNGSNYVVHAGTANIDPKKAELIWDENAIISAITFKDNYIYFAATGNLGNALIAAEDGSGKILWSWHIWCTKDIKEVTWYSGDKVMDRNLGAWKASSSDVTEIRGLFYQWGRKDPFRETDYSKIESSANTGTIDYAIAHPTDYITGFNSTSISGYRRGSWLWESTLTNGLWGNSSRNNTCTKTIYDPCPPGYKLPSLNTWKNVTRKSFDDKGVYFTVNSQNATEFFPYGSINFNGNWLDYDGSYKGKVGRQTTSCTYNSTGNNSLIGSIVFITDKFFKVNNGDFRSQGMPTRCIKE